MTEKEIEALKKKVKEQEELLELYREMVGRMALAKDKNESWELMKMFWNHTRTIGFDLKTEEEQQAFIFGSREQE